MASSVEISQEADTLPVCCMLAYSNWVEFHRKWSYHLFRGVRWKSKKNRILHVHYGTISAIFKGLVWINGMTNFDETAPIGCTVTNINPVEFHRKWTNHIFRQVLPTWPKITILALHALKTSQSHGWLKRSHKVQEMTFSQKIKRFHEQLIKAII